jgi:putative acetyltransferase
MNIQEISATDPEVRELFRLLDQHNLSHCPPETCNLTQPEQMLTPDRVLLGLFCEGTLVAMGGLKLFSDYAEITRMYTREEYRGQRLAEKILQALEERAASHGLKQLKLETSQNFEKAIKLYTRVGYQSCEAFGQYKSNPINYYMQKEL